MKKTISIGIFLLVAGGMTFAFLSSDKPKTPEATSENSSDGPSDRFIAKNLIKASAQEIKEMIHSSEAQLTLVNIWASWCEPCKEEFPALLKLRQEYKDKGLNLLLISADMEEAIPEALSFLKSQEVDFPTYIKGGQDIEFISGIYPDWSGALPASILFDESGKAVEFWQGAATFEEFEAAVTKFLNKL